eukprot:SAG31_NODE_12233_length_957_cov_1.039627_1_plen_111_part_10
MTWTMILVGTSAATPRLLQRVCISAELMLPLMLMLSTDVPLVATRCIDDYSAKNCTELRKSGWGADLYGSVDVCGVSGWVEPAKPQDCSLRDFSGAASVCASMSARLCTLA